MIKNNFEKTISKYLIEADMAPADQSPETNQPPSDGGSSLGGMPGGDLGGIGGGMPGGDLGGLGGDPMGGGQNQTGGPTNQNEVCSYKYVATVSYLCELYNVNISNKKNTVLNLKVLVGGVEKLNDVHNADEIFKFMISNFLEKDIVESVKENLKKVEKSRKKLKSDPNYKDMIKHTVSSSFFKDAVTCAYYAVCIHAIDEELPDINYGISKDFPVDLKNAKVVFDEIKSNIDKSNKMSEVTEG